MSAGGGDGNTTREDGSKDTAGGRDAKRAARCHPGGSGVGSLLHLCAAHTTAGVVINEHADPDVASDLEGVFDRLVPRLGPYRHGEGNSDSHAKAAMTGASQIVFVEEGKLALGTWQGVFFCEFDGPRERKMWVKVVGD